MVRAIDPKATWDYVPTCDRDLPPERRTVFKLRPLTARENARVEDAATAISPDGVIAAVSPGAYSLTVVRYGLAGYENFEGAPEFRRNGDGGAMDECLDAIPSRLRHELANAITEQTRLSEADRGN